MRVQWQQMLKDKKLYKVTFNSAQKIWRIVPGSVNKVVRNKRAVEKVIANQNALANLGVIETQIEIPRTSREAINLKIRLRECKLNRGLAA